MSLRNGKAGNKNGMNWIRPAKRLAIYLRDGFCCGYCGKDLHRAKEGQCSLDHLTPRSQGGSNEATNLITACLKCNVARGTTPWRQYATGGAIIRIARQRRLVLNVPAAKTIIAGVANFSEVFSR
jgi:hypothetical protein